MAKKQTPRGPMKPADMPKNHPIHPDQVDKMRKQIGPLRKGKK